MNSRTMMLAITIITSIILIPIITSASEISWSIESYYAYSYAAHHDPFEVYFTDYNENSGPPLPLSSVACSFGYCTNSLINTSIMNVNTYNVSGDAMYSDTMAKASFTGNFTAYSPVFKFDYDLSSSLPIGMTNWELYNFCGELLDEGEHLSGSCPYYGPGYGRKNNSWLKVTDLTNSTNLIDLTLTEGSNIISVNLSEGHNVEVSFGIDITSYNHNDGLYLRSFSDDIELRYNMLTIVPEPISSILFITGGALLGGRSYIRRKKA